MPSVIAYLIRLNNRLIVNNLLNNYLELDADTAKQVVHLLDKKQKMPEDSFNGALQEINWR